MNPDDDARAFIARWQGVAASELATAQSFVIELCALLGVERPHPSAAQDYMFERPVTFQHGDGSTSSGRIDCYRRGHFVLEAKKLKAPGHTRGFDDGMLRARGQAEGYARALPAAEGRPPFVLVVDVGNLIEVYAEFSRSGGTYTPFPDPRSHRIALADLAEPRIRQRLRLIWSEPDALDPARISAQVTRAVSDQLARLARSLEDSGHAPHAVAAYLSRCLFSMFAEDVELLPAGSFLGLLQTHQRQPATLRQMLRILWADMDRGGFSAALAGQVLHFNGKLFKGAHEDGYSLPLTPAQVELLIAAARANWREVEPAIFGTLLERALDPAERHALGAHYTPRAYVERLVLPTVIEPLRADWANAQAAALVLAHEAASLQGRAADARLAEARAEIRRFHHQLCTTRVLDPACGSANFLYVTLEHLKRLEGEVLNQLHELGHAQDQLGFEGETVTLQQLLGIELNPRAAALAELVLWIGWLQWHIRARGNAAVAEPVVHDYRNIDCRDAVLAWDAQEPAHDAAGQPRTRWDGVTYKRHPVTGEPVPDEAAQVPQWRYVGARPAAWPRADFIVGNPPFIGNKRMREALGDGYVEALRAAWPDVPESSDFVMYWWQRAARQVAAGQARRMGLITTNSLTMVFNRRVVQAALAAGTHLEMAIADHPWVDSAGNAAVRIAMTVLAAGSGEGELLTVTDEQPAEHGESAVTLAAQSGLIHADLTVGANTANLKALQANKGLACPGVQLSGQGFLLSPSDAEAMRAAGSGALVKRYFTGRDLMQAMREQYVLDTLGFDSQALRDAHPVAYQWLYDKVKPEREAKRSTTPDSIEYAERWWLFSKPRPKFRQSLTGLSRFLVTSRTARHRIFQFTESSSLPETKVLIVALDDAYFLGVLQSSTHIVFANQTGGWLGVGNDSTYNHSDCFEKFPFPGNDTGLTSELRQRIAALAEQIDQHRKRVLAPAAGHAGLTLTGLYNVLAALREGRALTAKEQAIHTQGLVGVLRELHDELDAAVRAAYGLPASATTDDVLAELVRLNARRAAEEAQGQVRWLRPAFQQAPAAPADQPLPGLAPADAPEAVAEGTADAASPAAPAHRPPWPAALPAQIRLLADTLAASATPLSLEQLAARFQGKGRWRERLPTLLDTLAALGRVQPQADGRWAALR